MRDAGAGAHDVSNSLVAPGIWVRLAGAPRPERCNALFLDRDGVIVDDTGYLCRPAEVRLVPGVDGLIRSANGCGIPVVVVTNQSGIARGLFGWEEFAAVEAEIAHRLEQAGAYLDAVVACPFHPDFTADYARLYDGWRKPGPRMITLAAEKLNIDTERSFMVGDNVTDVGAAEAARLAGAVLVLTGHGRAQASDVRAFERPGFSVAVATDTMDALPRLRELGLAI